MKFHAALIACAMASAADPWIGALGGSSIQDASGNVTEISLRGTWVGDADIARLLEHP